MGVRVVFPDMGKDPSVQLIEKTITENGTYDAITDGANGYSKVNVNVEGGGGSSDFSTAEVTVDITAVTDDDYAYNIIMPYISEGNGHKDSRGSANYWSLSGGVGTYQAILTGEGVIAIVSVPTNGNIETSGNIGGAMVPTDEGYQAFLITGDCTITITKG